MSARTGHSRSRTSPGTSRPIRQRSTGTRSSIQAVSVDRGFAESHGERGESPEGQMRPPLQWPRLELEIGETPKDRGEGDLTLQARQGGPEAEVTGPPERQVPIVGA